MPFDRGPDEELGDSIRRPAEKVPPTFRVKATTCLAFQNWHHVALREDAGQDRYYCAGTRFCRYRPQGTKSNELGAEVLLAITREFTKSPEWLLTGEE